MWMKGLLIGLEIKQPDFPSITDQEIQSFATLFIPIARQKVTGAIRTSCWGP
jgi:hypothetical protein